MFHRVCVCMISISIELQPICNNLALMYRVLALFIRFLSVLLIRYPSPTPNSSEKGDTISIYILIRQRRWPAYQNTKM